MKTLKENIEAEILELALTAFNKTAPAQTKLEILEREPGNIQGLRADCLLRLEVRDKELQYFAEIKQAFARANKLMLLMAKDRLPHPVLLITRYVTPQMAEELKQDGIEFIDAAGNAFINQPPLYIFVKGNKPPELAGQERIKRVFMAAGLRIIYLFLCNPGFENKTYREIAGAADVALGTVNRTMEELRELDFLLDMGKQGKKMIQKENLLQRWVTAYPEQLKPKQMLGRYKGEPGWWRQKQLNPQTAQWGGEAAAAKLTQYLKPEIITIYTKAKQLPQFLIEYRLKKDPAGYVEILERFWRPTETWQYNDLVHPILIYADLLATGNQRNMETAKVIYEQHIVRFVRED